VQSAREIAAVAAAWLIRVEREATPELWDALQVWIDSHPRHRAEFIRQRTAWNRCDKLKMLRPGDGTIDADLLSRIEFTTPEGEGAASGGRGRFGAGGDLRDGAVDLSRRGWLALTAATGIAILGAWYFALQTGWDTYRTAVGARQLVTLSDGSTADLNTGTELRVRMSPGRREVLLEHGEALFRVAHDPRRPFSVTAQSRVVRAVGTEFCVRIRDDDRVEVLVTEGRVALGMPGGPAHSSASAFGNGISMGEIAMLSDRKVDVRHVGTQELDRRLAWTSGRLAFQGETLGQAVEEFNRYNVRQLTIADASIRQMRIGGTFSSTDPDSFVAALEHSFRVAAIRAPDGRGVSLIARHRDAGGNEFHRSLRPSTVRPASPAARAGH